MGVRIVEPASSGESRPGRPRIRVVEPAPEGIGQRIGGSATSGGSGATARGSVRAPGRRVSQAEDIARSGAGGVLQGAIATGNLARVAVGQRSGDLDALAGWAVRTGANALGLTNDAQNAEWERRNTEARRAMGSYTTAELSNEGLGGLIGAGYDPQTRAGRWAHTGGLFASGALIPGGWATRAGAVLIPTIGAEGSATAVEAMGGDEGAQNIARGVGGLAGAIASPSAWATRGATVTREPNALRAVVDSFDQAQVTPGLAAVDGGRGMARVTSGVAENPFGGFLVRDRVQTQVRQAQQSAENIGARYGTARGPQTTGANAQAGARRFAGETNARGEVAADSFRARSRALYDQVYDQIPADGVVATPRTEAMLGQVRDRAQGPIGELINDPALARIDDAIRSGQGTTRFADLRAFRTWLGETVLQTPNHPMRQSIGDAALRRLYGAVTEDIAENAATLGGQAAAARLRRADQYYRAGRQRIDNALAPVSEANAGEGAYAAIRRMAGSNNSADVQSLLSLRRSLRPDEWGDVASQVINDMGRPIASAGVEARDAGFSLATFTTNYASMSPRGRQILFGSVGGGGARATQLQRELDNLASVVERLRNVERAANVSNSGVAVQTVGTLGAAVASPVTTAKIIGGLILTGEAMTNPALVRWLANIPRTTRTPGAWEAHRRALDAIVRSDPALASIPQQVDELVSEPVPQGAANAE